MTVPARVQQAELEALCCQPTTLSHCRVWTLTWDALHAAKKPRSVHPRAIFNRFCSCIGDRGQFDLCMIRLMATALNTTYTRQNLTCQEVTRTINGWRKWVPRLLPYANLSALEYLLELIGTPPDSRCEPMSAEAFGHLLGQLVRWWSLKARDYSNSDASRLTGWIRPYMSAHPSIIHYDIFPILLSQHPFSFDEDLVLSTIEQCSLLGAVVPSIVPEWVVSHFHTIRDVQHAVNLLRRVLATTCYMTPASKFTEVYPSLPRPAPPLLVHTQKLLRAATCVDAMDVIWDIWIHRSHPPTVGVQQQVLMCVYAGHLDTLGSEIAANGLTRSTFIQTGLTQANTIQNPKITSDMVEWVLARECLHTCFNTLEDAFKHQPDHPYVIYLMTLWYMCASDICPQQRLYDDPVWQRLGLDYVAGPGSQGSSRYQELGWADSRSDMYECYMEHLLMTQLKSARSAITRGHRKRAREPSPPPTPPTESPAKRQRTQGPHTTLSLG